MKFPNSTIVKKKFDEAVKPLYEKYDNSSERYRVNIFWEDVDEDKEDYVAVITKYFFTGQLENIKVIPVVGVFVGNELQYTIENPSKAFWEAVESEEVDVLGELIDDYTES